MKFESLMKRYKWLIALALLAIIVLYFVNNPLQSTLPRFQIAGKNGGYFYSYDFSGKTTLEFREGEHYTIDAVHFPFWSEKNSIAQRISQAIVDDFVGDLKSGFAEAGYQFTVLNVEPKVEITTRTVTRQYRDYTGYTMYHTIHISATLDFKTDKKIPDQILNDINSAKYTIVKPLGITAVAVAIAIIIISSAVAYAIATVANSFVVNESSIIEEYYDENGNLISRKTYTKTGVDWSSVLPQLAIILAVTVIAIFAMNIYLRRRWGG